MGIRRRVGGEVMAESRNERRRPGGQDDGGAGPPPGRHDGDAGPSAEQRSKVAGSGSAPEGARSGPNPSTKKRTRPSRSPSAAAPRDDSPPALGFPVVGVGASAGGVEAFSELLRHLPRDTGMAYVLIQHLSPKHKTILPEILARQTDMPVLLAEHEMELLADHVYVLPPAGDMTVFHGRLNLMERTSVAGAHLPIDYFLRSLALDQRTRAIGVVLSGTASDGSLGLAAIKAEGGITFAQEPASARYDGMPSSAIAANAVDVVRDPEGIAAELARLGKHPYLVGDVGSLRATPVEQEGEADWMKRIFVILRSVFGVDFSAYRRSTIERRVERRIALYHMSSIKEYEDYLRGHPDEVEDLYHDILIMVTEFFREAETFQALSDVILPRIVEEKRNDDQVRIWVPGCATGEEPYSIALTLQKVMRQTGRDLPVKIFATDISERDIARARAGVYGENKIQTIPQEYRHFFVESDGGYQISKTIRDMVVFARHDVTADPPFSQLDLVSCRNLLIYLGPAAQDRVIPVLHYALRPPGYLVLGPSESISGSTDLFAPVDKKNKIFVKKAVPHRVPESFAFAPSVQRMDERDVRLSSERRFDPQHTADELLLSQYAPASVVIDDDFEIMQFRGATDDFLKHSSGRASLNLLDMAREGLGPYIRKAVEDARASGAAVRRTKAHLRRGGGMRALTLEVLPIRGPAYDRYYVVLFHLDAPPEPAAADHVIAAAEGRAGEAEELRRELDSSREYMQAIVQDKEAALEELRAANEEIQSSNEELQSINEELETAQEELQSTNEELHTVNEELEHRNVQLSHANDDLTNLLRAVSTPTIMVGRDLRLRRFTPGTERVMNLIASDIGRPITDIAPRLIMPDLGEILQSVIENITVQERELQDEHGHWFAMRVRPYQTEENRIEGAVITFTDVDDLRAAVERIAQVTHFGDALNRILGALQSERDPARAARNVLGEAGEALGADAAAVLRHREQDAWLVRFAHGLTDGIEGSSMSGEQIPQAAMAESSGSPVSARIVNGIHLFGRSELTRSLLVAPMVRRGVALGSVLFTWPDGPPQPLQDAEDFAAKAAALTALALTE
jgi:two-component system, chemotaxis family, CheB/CheR fusion protein